MFKEYKKLKESAKILGIKTKLYWLNDRLREELQKKMQRNKYYLERKFYKPQEKYL